MGWTLLNVFVLASPFVLLWGWAKYLNVGHPSDWRSRASLIGLSAPLASVAFGIVTLVIARANQWDTSNPAVHRMIDVGMSIPLLGMLIGLVGRPLLILAIVPASLGTVLFWWGTSLP